MNKDEKNLSKENDIEKTCQMEAPKFSQNDETIVHDGNETKMGDVPDMEMLSLGAKFVIISKVRKGEEFYITSKSMEVGRGEDCDLKLDFPGISRKHFKTVINNGTVSIEDLGSKYGTFIGKNKIDASKTLKPGDIIQAGELTLRFETSLGGGQVSLLNNKKILIAGGVFLVLICLLFFVKLSSKDTKPNVQVSEISAPKVIESVKLTESAQDLIYQAQAFVKENNLEYALQKIESALQIEPTNKQALNFKEIWSKQFDQNLKIEKAKGLIDIGSFESAKVLIDEILAFSPENNDAKILIKRIQKLSLSQEAMKVLKESRELIKEGQYDQAESILSAINDPELESEKKDIQNEIIKLKKLEEFYSNASSEFDAGELEKALILCKDGLKLDYKNEKINALKTKIEKINNLRKDADKYLEASSPSAKGLLLEIIEMLPTAHSYAVKASNDLTMLNSVSVLISYESSQSALKQLANGNLKGAMTELNKLVEDFPENPDFKIIRDEFKVRVDNLAKALYRAGYVLENTDPLKAKEIWQRLLNAVPDDHPYAKKVKIKIKL